jgi:hypothetical protein
MGNTFNADTITIAAYVFYNLVYATASYPLGALADKFSLKKNYPAGLFSFRCCVWRVCISSFH